MHLGRDVSTAMTVMENILHAFSLDKTGPEAITRFHQRNVHNTEIVETPQDDPPGPPIPENDPPDLPESDLDIPDDPILDFVNSQCHSSEDLDQALQAYLIQFPPKMVEN